MAAPRFRSVLPWTLVLIGLATVAGSIRAEESGASAGALFAGARSSMALIGREVDAGGSPGVNWLGTGFMVDRKCTLASAKHILHGVEGDRFLVRMHSRDTRRSPILHARVIYRKPALDLVFLQLVGSTIGQKRCPDEFRSHLKLSESFDDGLAGEAVLLAGFPMLEGQLAGVPVLRHGHVSSGELEWEGNPMLLLDLRSAPGFSGAPVILERTGEVIAVLFGSGLTPREYDLTWATPITRADHRAALRGGERQK